MEPLIETFSIQKPTFPNRSWFAVLIIYEEGDPVGWGSTETEAVENLIEKCLLPKEMQ